MGICPFQEEYEQWKSMLSLLHYLLYGYRTRRQLKIPSFFKNNTYDTSYNLWIRIFSLLKWRRQNTPCRSNHRELDLLSPYSLKWHQPRHRHDSTLFWGFPLLSGNRKKCQKEKAVHQTVNGFRDNLYCGENFFQSHFVNACKFYSGSSPKEIAGAAFVVYRVKFVTFGFDVEKFFTGESFTRNPCIPLYEIFNSIGHNGAANFKGVVREAIPICVIW